MIPSQEQQQHLGAFFFKKIYLFGCVRSSLCHVGSFLVAHRLSGASQVVLVIKNLPASAGDLKDTGSIPRSGRSAGGEHSNPLQYSCLENPMYRGALWATVHRVAQAQTQLNWLSRHAFADSGCGTVVLVRGLSCSVALGMLVS